MIAFAIYVSIPLAVLAAVITVWMLLPKRLRPRNRFPTSRWVQSLRTPKIRHQFNSTASAKRIRYTSTESDIRNWDLVHVRDGRMIIHHVSIIVGMTVMVTIILVTGETAGAIATGALASQDGIELIKDLMNRA